MLATQQRPAAILVNATTLTVGGGVQAGISFIEFALNADTNRFDFLFLITKAIHDGLPGELRADKRIIVFDVSPARPRKGAASRSRLRQLENQFAPDIVYSLGFPSYVRFTRPEIGRYTNGWEFCATPLSWSLLPIRERVVVWLRAKYRIQWAKNAAYFETQTETAKKGIERLFHLPPGRVKVIPNSPNPIFFKPGSDCAAAAEQSANATVFCLSAAFRHKNLHIIPHVAKILMDRHPERRIEFVLTLATDNAIWKEIERAAHALGVADRVVTCGPLKLKDCIAWYRKADAVFLPTALEIFSATYVEAMAMRRAIVTPDLDFAREICADAAEFYDPHSVSAAAEAIHRVTADWTLRQRLIENGLRQLASFPYPAQKNSMLMDWLRDIAHKARSEVRSAHVQ